MTKMKKLAVVLLLLFYTVSSVPVYVLAASETESDSALYEGSQQAVTETLTEEPVTPEPDSTTEADEQDNSETQTESEFDESGYDFSDMAPDLGEYVDPEDIGDLSVPYEDLNGFEDFDDNIDAPSFEPGYEFSEGDMLLTTEQIRTTENKTEITLDKTINGQDFKRMVNDEQLENAVADWLVPLKKAKDQHFFTMQGSCFDGEYWYFAFTVNYWYGDKKIYTQEGYMIIRVPENNLDDFLGEETTITYFEGVELFHLNDMTYNTVAGELVIAACTDGDHDSVYTIARENLGSNRKVSENNVGNEFVKHNVSCNVTAIAFSEKDGCYIVGLTNRVTESGGENIVLEHNIHRFAKLDYNFNLIKVMGEKEVELPIANPNLGLDESWERQTIFVDNNYIYNLLHLYNPKTREEDKKLFETENMIEIYDLAGNYKKSVYFTVPQGTDRRYEAENINIVDGRIYIGFNCAKGIKYRDFCYYDLTEYGFSVTYCPDDNIASYIAGGNMPSSFVLRGFGAQLFTNPFSENGKAFAGWNAYRYEVDKWFYVNADNTTAWYKEGEQPEGYTKYVYDNKATVKNTGLLGEHVYMVAQWKSSNNFKVYFAAPDVTQTKYSQTITHGTPTALNANTFTKTNRTFKGWNAYWVEKKQWLYVDSADSSKKQWCLEGTQPKGYKKYVYSDGEAVSKTVHKGNQVIMYAVWDEFFIYYNPNGDAKAAHQLLLRKRGWNSGGNVNSISPFTISNFKGYNLYWCEADKWLYYNSTTKDLEWFKKGSQTSGYSLYLKTFSNGTAKIGSTVPYGQSLVLYAKW